MGWDGRIDTRPAHEVITEDLEKGGCTVLKRSGKYYAVRNNATGLVVGLVVLSRREDRVWLYTKFISEDMGPAEAACPDSVLRLLSPAEEIGGYAAEWRERCREHNEKKKSAGNVALTLGTVIELAEPMLFTNGESVTRMTFLGGYKFRSERGTRLTLPKGWRANRVWRVVAPAEQLNKQ